MLDARITLVDSFGEAEQFMDWCGLPHDVVTIDTETTGVDWRGRMRTFQIGDENTCWVIPFERGGWGGLVRAGLELFRNTTFLMHNFKFDQTILSREGLELPDDRVIDTRIMAHLVDPTQPTGLKPLADRLIGPYSSRGQQLLDEKMKKNKWTWATVPVDTPEFWWYAGLDTVLTTRVYRILVDEVFPRFQGIYDLEYACQVVLKKVERKGVRVDLEYVSMMLETLREQAGQIRTWARNEWGIKNLTSDMQVSDRMIADGWEPSIFTNTGRPSMAKNAIANVTHPLAKALLKVKHLEKMASTQYLGSYQSIADVDLIRPQINPLGARTGRMSISSPALQTLHRDAIVRDAFIPRDGNKLIFADYDQMEVRLTAHFTRDPNYARIIESSTDVHTDTAAQIYRCDPSEVTKHQRAITKNAVYAIIYGAGLDKFALTAGIDVDDAREFLGMYHRAFPGVSVLQNDLQQLAMRRRKEEGLAYVMSPYGRRHTLGRWEAEEPFWDEQRGKWIGDGHYYKLLNYLVQGTGADVLKRAVVDADRAGIGDYLVLLVHDEMGFDVPEGEIEEVKATVKDVMEEHEKFTVPLTVDAKVVDRWGDKYRDVPAAIEMSRDDAGHPRTHLKPKASHGN